MKAWRSSNCKQESKRHIDIYDIPTITSSFSRGGGTGDRRSGHSSTNKNIGRTRISVALPIFQPTNFIRLRFGLFGCNVFYL